MGLTIFYSGKLRDTELLNQLVMEVTDACIFLGWRFEYVKRSSIMPMKGMMVTPEGSEPIYLTFIESGHLANPGRFMHWDDPQSLDIYLEQDGVCFTKTQYAGVDGHMAIIKLLRYISQKYFSEFKLLDESSYWEQNDEHKCRERFEEFESIVGMLGAALNEAGFEDHDDSQSQLIDDWLGEKGINEELLDYSQN